MNLRKNNCLKDLKAQSMSTQDLVTIKGGVAFSLSGPGGTSKPKRPTSQMAYIGILFGG